MTTRNGWLAILFHTLFVGFIVAPLLMVVWVAFTPEGYLALPLTRFSLRWFVAILDSDFIPAFWNSLILGVMSATLSLALAVPAAVAIVRHRFPGRDAIAAFFLAPLMVPHLIIGVSMLRFVSVMGFGGSWITLTASHVLIIFPFAFRLALAALVGFERPVEWAAISLGADTGTVWRRITLPIIMPGLAGGWILAFLQSFDELTMTIFMATPGTTTLPVRMYQYLSDNIDPLIASVSAALIIFSVAVMALIERLWGLDRLLSGKGR